MAVAIAGCGEDYRPAIAAVNPLNGATAVAPDFKWEIRLADGAAAALEEGDRRLVLYDITGGGQRTIAGSILIENNRLTYEPSSALEQDHLYEVVIARDAVSGDKLEDVDGSEWPPEPLVWPFRTRFATFSAPRVRAVYLDHRHRLPRVYVRFSQPMNQVATNDQIRLVDQLGNALAVSRPVWVDSSSARLDVQSALDPAGIYTLHVGADARASDGVPLDGNADGSPGGARDSFAVQFTGSEEIVLSRLVDRPDRTR